MVIQNQYKVDDEKDGLRLDVFVTENEDDLSRSYIKKLISEGYITVDKKQAKPSYKLHLGEIVRINLPDTNISPDKYAENIPLDIIYEDDEVIVVNKPFGMIVHPAANLDSGTLVNALVFYILNNPDKGINEKNKFKELVSITPERPGIVHRIDKGTSGILVVAKTAKTYYYLINQFKERRIRKRYLALVCGNLKHEKGIITAPIGRSRRDRKKMTVTSIGGKEAVTEFSVICYYENFSLLDIELKTGRTHQIRVHFSHIGYPIVGDPDYGGRNKAIKMASSQNVISAIQKLDRQALHAKLLGFIHPITGEYMEFSVSIPKDIQNVINNLENEFHK
ncbi:RluA family pseudouridine synthase [Candidatus Poribacteria bacterium]|nr:RluA family pseudouridine synthase [Candidatus Poribacteria bacterium]